MNEFTNVNADSGRTIETESIYSIDKLIFK